MTSSGCTSVNAVDVASDASSTDRVPSVVSSVFTNARGFESSISSCGRNNTEIGEPLNNAILPPHNQAFNPTSPTMPGGDLDGILSSPLLQDLGAQSGTLAAQLEIDDDIELLETGSGSIDQYSLPKFPDSFVGIDCTLLISSDLVITDVDSAPAATYSVSKKSI
ncbi:MAG: hypothetical protein M1814_006037 [Vezdaea aestivalis]|nr:MAG: hypothetical protein M1814_006037 [Vezdaea aestivalis]